MQVGEWEGGWIGALCIYCRHKFSGKLTKLYIESLLNQLVALAGLLVVYCLPAGDNLMYPTPYHDLSGWNIKSMTCGSTTFACAATYGAEKSTITWGHSNGYR